MNPLCSLSRNVRCQQADDRRQTPDQSEVKPLNQKRDLDKVSAFKKSDSKQGLKRADELIDVDGRQYAESEATEDARRRNHDALQEKYHRDIRRAGTHCSQDRNG